MRNASLEIGKSLKVSVTWYDKVLVPQANKEYEGEVIGWRKAQVIVSVKDYAVLRFWKKTGLEVGNRDYARRGFKIDVPGPGVAVTFDDDSPE